MQDMLAPIFGETGAIIIQYAVTLAVVVGLIALVVWAVRHYTGGAVRPAARGRLPRLAIVDTLPVDNKRRLVLLRRDNVEHLVLIGGPSDVVVEPSIIRQRVAHRPGAATATRPAQPGGPAPALAPSAPGVPAEPIEPEGRPATEEAEATETAPPVPARRTMTVAGDRGDRFAPPRRDHARTAFTAPAGPAAEPPAAAHPARTTRQAAAPAAPVAAEEPADDPDEPLPLRFVPRGQPSAHEPPDGPVPGYDSFAEDDRQAVSAFAPPTAESTATDERPNLADAGDSVGVIEVGPAPPTASGEASDEAAQSAGVSDLEKEMARLLDQISTTRRN